MMKRFRGCSKWFSLIMALLLSGLAGCVHDKLDGPDPSGKVMDIELVIPGFEIPLTRSIEGGQKGKPQYGDRPFYFSIGQPRPLNYSNI